MGGTSLAIDDSHEGPVSAERIGVVTTVFEKKIWFGGVLEGQPYRVACAIIDNKEAEMGFAIVIDTLKILTSSKLLKMKI